MSPSTNGMEPAGRADRRAMLRVREGRSGSTLIVVRRGWRLLSEGSFF